VWSALRKSEDDVWEWVQGRAARVMKWLERKAKPGKKLSEKQREKLQYEYEAESMSAFYKWMHLPAEEIKKKDQEWNEEHAEIIQQIYGSEQESKNKSSISFFLHCLFNKDMLESDLAKSLGRKYEWS
jgi:hypothetical protein